MSNPLMTKALVAAAAIAAFRIVKFDATDDTVITAAANTDALVGIVENVSPALGERVDVVVGGLAEVTLGGTVVRGALVTADATGRAVAAVATNRVIGVAMASGVVGDVVHVLISPGVF